MTSKHRDARATVRPEQRAKLNAFIAKKFADANKTLNAMTAQYKPKVAAKANVAQKPMLVAATVRVDDKKTTLQKPQKQKMVLQLWLQQQQRQRTAA